MLAREIHNRAPEQYAVVGFLDDAPSLHGATVDGVPVLGVTADLPARVHSERADEVLQRCGRELERGFRVGVLPGSALAAARVLLLCDAHGLPGAQLTAEELAHGLLAEQAADGGWPAAGGDPARAAASVGRSPATPTIAAITVSTSGRLATCSSAPVPLNTSQLSPACCTRRCSSRAAAGSSSAATRGRNARHCSNSAPAWLRAASATTSNRSRWRATTSSVLTPTLPVEPSIASRFLSAIARAVLYPTQGSNSAAKGMAEFTLSIRSRMPPCPGRSAPLSFTPAWRLIHDS